MEVEAVGKSQRQGCIAAALGACLRCRTAGDALTDDRIDGLQDLLADARRSPEAWQDFLQGFVDAPELRARLASAEPQA